MTSSIATRSNNPAPAAIPIIAGMLIWLPLSPFDDGVSELSDFDAGGDSR